MVEFVNEPTAETRDQLLRPSGSPVGPAATSDDRPLPFVLRRCLTWLDINELPTEDDGQLHFWKRVGLTGGVATTDSGRDVHFSDLEDS